MNWITLGGRDIPVVLVRKNIKNLYLRLRPEGFLAVNVPRAVSEAAVEAFIRRHGQRILAELDRMAQATAPDPSVAWVLGEKVNCQRGASPKPSVAFRDRTLVLGTFPDERNERIRLERFYGSLVLAETRKILSERQEELTRDFDLSGIVLKTQRMKTRLGSCQTRDRVIKLNTVLGRFDRRYLEAILLHELCHLRVPNHGADFYRLLEKHVPDYRYLRTEILDLVRTRGV